MSGESPTDEGATIEILCATCGRSKRVKRDICDPPTATSCVMSECSACENAGGFESVAYFDEAGKEVSGDPEDWEEAGT